MKSRTVLRTRAVPHTIGGKTHMVTEQYEVQVPVPPRDWDRIMLATVTGTAGLLVLVTVVWSTANIGDLLAHITVVGAAYAAAVAFDLAWIMCMVIEWLARYDRRRARMPRAAGHLALGIAMAAVAVHGWTEGQHAIGIIGAAVSGLVKGLWTVVLGFYAAPLDPRTQAWVEQQLAEAGARQALIPVQRQLLRSEGAIEAERLALGQNTLISVEAKPARPSVPSARPVRTQPPSAPAGPIGDPIENIPSLLAGAHAPIVYFIRNGNRVKIGTSQNLKRRLAALTLRADDVVRAEHGGQRHERDLHGRFAEQRTRNTEWFDLTGTLAAYLGIAIDAPVDANAASTDAPTDARDAEPDAPEVSEMPPPPPLFPSGGSKSSLILAASSMLHPDAPAAEIAHLLAQHGYAVDTAYIRTVLSRKKQEDETVGKGGGGYA